MPSLLAELRPLVCMRFQVLFHSPPGVLFTFPSRYWFTIGRQEYLALDGGPPGFPHERPSTWYSGTRPRVGSLSDTGLSPASAGLSMPLLLAIPICNSPRESQLPLAGPTTPRLQRLRPITQPRFGLLRFRSPLLTECSLLLEVLRCFSSLGLLVPTYVFSRASP